MVGSIEWDDVTDSSSVLTDFFKPIYQQFEGNDTVIKVIEVSLKFFDGKSEFPSLHVSISCQTVYSILDKVPTTEEEIFDLFKNYVNSPADPDDEDEVGLTQEELAELRDPNGIRFLPVNSEGVQELVQDFQAALEETATALIYDIVQETLLELQEYRHSSKDFRMDLEVNVIYADKLSLTEAKNASFAQTIVSTQLAHRA
ncbi:MAG TPA: hypothetical protein PKW79_04195 [Rhabdochlamydiaceae bacterium]|nr:hypothetical protein [Rhabdochlamydiaceae bacterium]